jgi:hypothetical protein
MPCSGRPPAGTTEIDHDVPRRRPALFSRRVDVHRGGVVVCSNHDGEFCTVGFTRFASLLTPTSASGESAYSLRVHEGRCLRCFGFRGGQARGDRHLKVRAPPEQRASRGRPRVRARARLRQASAEQRGCGRRLRLRGCGVAPCSACAATSPVVDPACARACVRACVRAYASVGVRAWVSVRE